MQLLAHPASLVDDQWKDATTRARCCVAACENKCFVRGSRSSRRWMLPRRAHGTPFFSPQSRQSLHQIASNRDRFFFSHRLLCFILNLLFQIVIINKKLIFSLRLVLYTLHSNPDHEFMTAINILHIPQDPVFYTLPPKMDLIFNP